MFDDFIWLHIISVWRYVWLVISMLLCCSNVVILIIVSIRYITTALIVTGSCC